MTESLAINSVNKVKRASLTNEPTKQKEHRIETSKQAERSTDIKRIIRERSSHEMQIEHRLETKQIKKSEGAWIQNESRSKNEHDSQMNYIWKANTRDK